MEQPLLSEEKRSEIDENERLSSYQYVGRTGSVIPTASLAGTDVSIEEIRSATSFSTPYPPSIHAPLISSPEPLPNVLDPNPSKLEANKYSSMTSTHFDLVRWSSSTSFLAKEIAPIYLHLSTPFPLCNCQRKTMEQPLLSPAIPNQSPYAADYGPYSNDFQRQLLDEVEIRELLIDHIGHRCCWGSRPARTWKIHAVEDCNVYVGTLETFLEEREVIRETEPYLGGKIDGKDNTPELGIWELDLRSQFPVLFVPYKETRVEIPNSETTEKCSDCAGRGDIPCPTCNADQEPGFYKENQMSQCPACYGRGLIAHRDGSDTM
ncbi:hypothetical protein GOBAR_AA37456 [Gossypium barbadense]|uniref:Uncharacterized protein n=1 Tax=Gossypium barbadense TaxID=3634 RepID=A0A2P5VWS6_GOSBA|nr:hypothetical protein GOBAR_AA37456 [Gossypium barbadense]